VPNHFSTLALAVARSMSPASTARMASGRGLVVVIAEPGLHVGQTGAVEIRHRTDGGVVVGNAWWRDKAFVYSSYSIRPKGASSPWRFSFWTKRRAGYRASPA
jgi:hypothetical protein